MESQSEREFDLNLYSDNDSIIDRILFEKKILALELKR